MPSSRESGRTQWSQQKQSHRTPLQLRTSSSESDGHHPPTRRASSKLADRRSNVRAPMTEARSASNGITTCQKKRGGPRAGDMATQLRQAQDEIKKLQDRLSAFEAANIKVDQRYSGDQVVQLADNQEEVKMSKSATSPSPSPSIDQLNNSDISHDADTPPVLVDVIRDGAAAEDHQELNSGEEETDVFEVPLTPVMPAPETIEQQVNGDHMKSGEEFPVPEKEEERQQQVPPLKLVPGGSTGSTNNNEVLQRHVMELEAKLAEKEEEVEKLVAESESLKKQAAAAEADAASARRQEEEAAAKMNGMGEELAEMRRKVGETEEALKEEMAAKAGIEEEMKRLRVQTEQWRKAADAAAEVLAGDGRRCGSMESKNLFGYAVSGMGGFAHRPAPMMDDLEEGGKKRGGGIRVLGDLWKKKHQHHH